MANGDTSKLKENHWSTDPERKAAVIAKILATKRQKGVVK
jgi:hypothetical protein